MDFRKFTPSSLLNPFIKSIVFINVPFSSFTSNSNLYIPNGCPAMVIHLFDSMTLIQQNSRIMLPKVFFSGLLDKPANLNPAGDILSILILFRPNALSQLFNIPMDELNALRYIDAQDIIGRKTAEIYERLHFARSNGIEEQYRIIENYFEKLIDSRDITFDSVDAAVDLITKANGCIGIKQIAGCAGISERSLRRNFLLKMGYSPKEFARICRFTHIMQLLQTEPTKDWSEIITLSGIYDQSHLIKEVKNFTENSPGEILCRNQQLLKMLNGMI